MTVSTIPKIPKDILAKVVAVTMFGSPPCPEMVKDRCNSYCNKGDFVWLSRPSRCKIEADTYLSGLR